MWFHSMKMLGDLRRFRISIHCNSEEETSECWRNISHMSTHAFSILLEDESKLEVASWYYGIDYSKGLISITDVLLVDEPLTSKVCCLQQEWLVVAA